MSAVFSYRDAAKELGLSRETISDVVRCLRLKPAPHPRKGRGLALTPADLRKIRKALGMSAAAVGAA